MHSHCYHCHHHHHHEEGVSSKLYFAFFINMLLTIIELVAGVIGGSIALVGDALHNTGDAMSILIAIIALKIGMKKADDKYSFGFKRAETIGAFVNLILLFVSGVYLFVEGVARLINPEQIDGKMIVWVSVLALIIDTATAKLTHTHSHENMNIKMLFIHNLADALGSIGVIVSGVCVVLFGWNFVDSVIALLIAFYMVFQSVVQFPNITNILMNSAPENISLMEIKNKILSIKNVCGIHHIHIWNLNEKDVSFECHIVAKNRKNLLAEINKVLKEDFGITHTNIQIEDNNECDCEHCGL